MLKGRIININSTKYLVDVNDNIYDCTLRGIFRHQKITPYVGDYVMIDENKNQVVEVLERKNILTRPNIANVDIAIIITSTKSPDLDLNLLDKLITMIICNKIEPLICFSKTDLLSEDEKLSINNIKSYYESIGIKCAYNDELEKLQKYLSGKVATTCGQTGAGKSTFINKIDDTLHLETKPISESLNRGVHTTRYVSLYKIKDYYIADTPGFSSLDISSFSQDDIKNSFKEFNNFNCKYADCFHINTDGCEVIKNIGSKILESRYDNYTKFIKEKNENSSKFFSK